ncbi:unnamed protein product, partial [Meganyctiphanes norvegica]
GHSVPVSPVMSGLLQIILLLLTLVAVFAVASGQQDEVSNAVKSSGLSVMSSNSAGSSLIFQSALASGDVDEQAVIIRKRRSLMGKRAGYPNCRGPNCRRRNRWKPSYLLSIQEKNSPNYQRSRSRRRNDSPSVGVFVPKRSDPDTISKPIKRHKPVYQANPRPSFHPKRSKGAIR